MKPTPEGVSIAAKCTCGQSISGICVGDCKKQVIVWSDFVNKYNVTEEEQQQLYTYLQFIRLSPHVDELKKISIRLKQILK